MAIWAALLGAPVVWTPLPGFRGAVLDLGRGPAGEALALTGGGIVRLGPEGVELVRAFEPAWIDGLDDAALVPGRVEAWLLRNGEALYVGPEGAEPHPLRQFWSGQAAFTGA